MMSKVNIKLLIIFYALFYTYPSIAEGDEKTTSMAYPEFMGIKLDEAFWVLIAFILFIIIVGKKATKAINKGLDARSIAIKDKINISENALKEAKILLNDSQLALTDHKTKTLELIDKQKFQAHKNAAIYLDNVKNEIDRKIITAEREVEYMHTEVINNIKSKITEITLKSVEEILVTEFSNDKSNKVFDNFIKDIPSALAHSK
ncbi:hypothetical protein OAC06_04020 [Alphaproteobacteria bacterium]|nr:hypothetical protein [Alphaproteobacteria bacterium]